MSPVISKQEYRAPADMLELERERLNITSPLAALKVASAPLLGTWVNCDHAARGLVRVMIGAKGNEITLHCFGACTPTPCDWGQVDGRIYSDSVADTPAVAFTATYNLNFKQTIIVDTSTRARCSWRRSIISRTRAAAQTTTPWL